MNEEYERGQVKLLLAGEAFISISRRKELAIYQGPLRRAFLGTKAAFEKDRSGSAFSRDPSLAFPRES